MSLKLAENIESRLTKAYECDAFISAIFLDARYRVMLTPDQNARARKHLERLWRRMNELNADESSEVNIKKITKLQNIWIFLFYLLLFINVNSFFSNN